MHLRKKRYEGREGDRKVKKERKRGKRKGMSWLRHNSMVPKSQGVSLDLDRARSPGLPSFSPPEITVGACQGLFQK